MLNDSQLADFVRLEGEYREAAMAAAEEVSGETCEFQAESQARRASTGEFPVPAKAQLRQVEPSR